MDWQLIALGGAASLAAGAATAVGAAAVFLVRSISQRLNDALLGFSAGVMLAASFFSLIIPGIDRAKADLGSTALGALVVMAAVMLGAVAISAINRYMPHEHFVLGHQGIEIRALRQIWLFVFAITLHNFPEGLAVGVGYGAGDIAGANVLALGIGLQNIPEGLAVAVALRALGYERLTCFSIGGATGLVEPVGGLLGISAVTLFAPLLPWGLGFAAGAMLFVVSNEIVPETHRSGHEQAATFGLMTGLAIMTFLDVTFS